MIRIQPLVSIGMPVYNAEKYLHQALDSLLVQDHINFELIICDNASTDKTLEVCQFYADQDQRIKFYQNETNIGASANFQKVFQLSKGQYFMWAAHDDKWHPQYISKCLKKLQENESAILCSSEIIFINEDDSIRDNWTKIYSNIDTLGMSIPQRVHQLINRVGWYSIYGLIKSKYLKQIENELNDSRYGADVIILLKLMLLGDLTKVPERLFYYRVADQEKTAEDYITNMANPSCVQEITQQPYSFLARELLHICLNSSLVSDVDKESIKKVFIETLTTQNLDWLNRITREQSWQIPVSLSVNEQHTILQGLMSKLLGINNQNKENEKEKKCLIFFPHNPYPAKSGAHQRCLSVIKALQSHDYNVNLCGWNVITDHHYPQDQLALKAIESELNVKIFVYQGTQEDYQFIQSNQSKNQELIDYATPGLRTFFGQLYQQLNPELVIVNYAMWGNLIKNSFFKNTVTILESHDLFTLNQKMQRSLHKYLSSPPYHPDQTPVEIVQEDFYSQQNLQASLAEYECFDQFDYTLAISSQEAQEMKNYVKKTEIAYLPMTYTSVNIDNIYQEKPIFAVGPNKFNVQGYLYFTKRVLPKILEVIPDFQLQVVGMICDQLAPVNGIELSGFVPDLTSVYASSCFAICPLIGGTGQQVKIVEAMAHGLSVIALSNVAHSSPIEHGLNGFIANNAEEFAEYTIQLWQDRKLCERLGIAARKTIAEKFSPQVIQDKLTPIINKANLKRSLQLSSFCHPKILIDGVFFQLYKTGIARVWKSLLQQWANTDFANHILVLDRANTAPKIDGIRYRTIPPYDYNNTEGDRQLLQQICDEEKAELFISTYYTTPIDTPSVFMAYDMIPEVLGRDLNQPMWREKHKGINHASAFIAISENTAKDINKYFPEIPLESITVAHCGVDPLFSPASPQEIANFKYKYGINKPYFLLGGLGGYKNSILFFQAFSQLANKQSFDIVATGANSQLPPEWRQFTAGCTFHGLQLTDEELRLAYAGAVALVYPSKYEGFGMPVAEAMACGCPVITTPNASLPEVGGEAVIYVNDDDIEGMANALCDVQKPSLRRNLIQAGLQQAQKFSWTTMAEIVKEALFNAISLQIKLTDTNFLINLANLEGVISINGNGNNYAIFPDWSADQEQLSLEISQVLTNLSEKEKSTLLVNLNNADYGEVELFFSEITLNLMLREGIDLSEKLQIIFVNFTPNQWQSLGGLVTEKITINCENLPENLLI